MARMYSPGELMEQQSQLNNSIQSCSSFEKLFNNATNEERETLSSFDGMLEAEEKSLVEAQLERDLDDVYPSLDDISVDTPGSEETVETFEKDANLYNENSFFNREKFRARNIGNRAVFRKIIASMAQRPRHISSQVDKLDLVLGGGYRIGLNVVGGLPGVGKTTLMLQSSVEMSDAGTPVIYITKDMRTPDILAKLSSYVSYKLYGKDCYTTSDITGRMAMYRTGEKATNVENKCCEMARNLEVVDILKDEFYETICEQDESLIECIIKHNSAVYRQPVFFLDCLQQFAKELKLGSKESVDQLLDAFKKLSAKYDAPLVLISTLNRSSYDKDLGLTAFKESGDIDFDCDTIIAIQPKNISDFDMDAFRAETYRQVEVKNLKLRDGGAVREEFCFCTFGNTFLDPCDGQCNSANTSKSKSSKAKKPTAPKAPDRKTGGAWV